MGITVSFGLKRFKEGERDYVHSFICIRYCGIRVFDICARKARKVLNI